MAKPRARRLYEPVIGLQRPEKKELLPGDSKKIKLRTIPANDTSPQYELEVPIFRDGSLEEYLIFLRNLKKVFTGQNLTTGPQQYDTARHLLAGDALACFNQAAANRGNETVDHLKECLDDLTRHIFPMKAYVKQKRYMRHGMQKPPLMTARQWVTCVRELDGYLPLFPNPSDTREAESLPEDKLLDALECLSPPRWQRKMMEHGFDLSLNSSTFVRTVSNRLRLWKTTKPLAKANEVLQTTKASHPTTKSTDRENISVMIA